MDDEVGVQVLQIGRKSLPLQLHVRRAAAPIRRLKTTIGGGRVSGIVRRQNDAFVPSPTWCVIRDVVAIGRKAQGQDRSSGDVRVTYDRFESGTVAKGDTMSAYGTTLQFTATQQFGRFRSKADID